MHLGDDEFSKSSGEPSRTDSFCGGDLLDDFVAFCDLDKKKFVLRSFSAHVL